MPDINKTNHPELDKLLSFSEGKLVGSEAEAIGSHLESCAHCRLEIKCYKRFNASDEEPINDTEIQWDRAEKDLVHAWCLNKASIISDARAENNRLRLKSQQRSWRSTLWLVPAAAAAAVVALVFLAPAFSPDPQLTSDAPSIVRGTGDSPVPQVQLFPPSGDRESVPEQFSWKTEVDCEYFNLEIFTSDLEKVFTLADIDTTSWTVTGDIIERLEPATIYLWSVQGFRQLQPVAESGNNWFRFPESEPSPNIKN